MIQLLWAESGLIAEHNVPAHVQVHLIVVVNQYKFVLAADCLDAVHGLLHCLDRIHFT